MADITMCQDSECQRHDSCYRYNARADKYRQSYFAESPRVDSQCDEYWKMKVWRTNHNDQT